MKTDMVYLWVNGNDPQWKRKKEEYMRKEVSPVNGKALFSETETSQDNGDTAGICRYIDNDELKYSLRSVELFAPWIDDIFIVTDGQIPEWLDTSNPRIHIVDHRDIIPQKYLPTFNSSIIEYYICDIPGLSEHFIFANDDMMIAREVHKDFFFNEEGLPVFRLKKQKVRTKKDCYSKMVSASMYTIYMEFGKSFRKAPHHNMDSYRKREYRECMEHFRTWKDKSSMSRFRRSSDLHRSIVGYYCLSKGKGVRRDISRYNNCTGLTDRIFCTITGSFRTDSRCIPASEKDYRKILDKYDPILFTINDGAGVTAEDRARMAEFLELYFPEKSSFEK